MKIKTMFVFLFFFALIFNCKKSKNNNDDTTDTVTDTDTATDTTTDEETDTVTTTDTGSSVTGVTVTYSAPTLHRTVAIDTDTSVRTVTFSYTEGATVTCSRDDGETYGDCDSAENGTGTIIWNVEDYAKQHIIKAVLGDYSDQGTFTPSTEYPDLEFVTCTSTVSADELFTAFDNRFAENAVICFDGDINITAIGANAGMAVNQNNMTIIAKESQTVTFESGTSSANGSNFGIFQTNGYDNLRLVGLTLANHGNVAGNTDYALEIGNGSVGIEIIDSTLTCGYDGANASCIYHAAGTAGSADDPIVLYHSLIDASVHAISLTGAVECSRCVLNITDSTITSGYVSLTIRDESTVNISNSTITSSKATSGLLGALRFLPDTNGNLVATIADSIISTKSMPAIRISTLNNKYLTLTLNGNIFKRMTNTEANPYAIENEDGAHTTLNSTTGNVFCHETAEDSFAGLIHTAAGGTFVTANQTPSDGISFAVCP